MDLVIRAAGAPWRIAPLSIRPEIRTNHLWLPGLPGREWGKPDSPIDKGRLNSRQEAAVAPNRPTRRSLAV